MVRKIHQHAIKHFAACKGRILDKNNWHITLAYFGAANVDQQRCIETQAEKITSQPFDLDLTSCGYWKKPQVAWLAPLTIPAELKQLAYQVQNNLVPCGFEPEKRDYKPHITLVRKAKQLPAVKEIQAIEWHVDKFCLVESVTAEKGAVYQPGTITGCPTCGSGHPGRDFRSTARRETGQENLQFPLLYCQCCLSEPSPQSRNSRTMGHLRTALLPALLCLPLAFSGMANVGAAPAQHSDTRAYNLAHGRVVFTEHCLRCHGEGREDAPMPDSAADWQGRLDQPLDELIRHAINGHGDMPARGETDLVDQEIAAAVAFVVYRARLVVAEQANGAAAGDTRLADSSGDGLPDNIDDAVMQMLLLLLGKQRW